MKKKSYIALQHLYYVCYYERRPQGLWYCFVSSQGIANILSLRNVQKNTGLLMTLNWMKDL